MTHTGKFTRLRTHAQAQEGFTLIELLVVILIIGILAAVAIPTFLSQTGKAKDSNLQVSLATVQTTEASYATQNGGSYTASQSALQTIEPTLATPFSTFNLTLSTSPSGLPSGHKGFSVTGTSTSSQGGTFTLTYDASTGQVIKSCSQPNKGGCNASGSW
jgi:type IV pilus assembly protein PilA